MGGEAEGRNGRKPGRRNISGILAAWLPGSAQALYNFGEAGSDCGGGGSGRRRWGEGGGEGRWSRISGGGRRGGGGRREGRGAPQRGRRSARQPVRAAVMGGGVSAVHPPAASHPTHHGDPAAAASRLGLSRPPTHTRLGPGLETHPWRWPAAAVVSLPLLTLGSGWLPSFPACLPPSPPSLSRGGSERAAPSSPRASRQPTRRPPRRFSNAPYADCAEGPRPFRTAPTLWRAG